MFALALFTWIYLALGLAVLTVELYGVFRRGHMDTISEHWWWFQDRHPVVARVSWLAFIVWLTLHFLRGTD